MIWKEKGLLKNSTICFLQPYDNVSEYYTLLTCGSFFCNQDYSVKKEGGRPPRLMYITAGTLRLTYRGLSHSAGQNEIILISCAEKHHYYCTDQCSFLFFTFNGSNAVNITNLLIEQNGGPVFHPSQVSEIYQAISAPILNLCYQEQISDMELSILVYTVLCKMKDCGSHFPNPASTGSLAVTSSIQYMKNHIRESISLKELAGHVNLTPCYFAHLFKKETEYTPIEYFSCLKLNQAKLILATTDSTITEISELLGYSSTSSFINAFKSRNGISPQKYRQKLLLRP